MASKRTMRISLYLVPTAEYQAENGKEPDRYILTEKGKHQARQLAQRLIREDHQFTDIFCSSHTPSQLTLTPYMRMLADRHQHPEIKWDERLRHQIHPDWDTGVAVDLHTRTEIESMERQGAGFCPPSGNSLGHVEVCMSHWLQSVLDDPAYAEIDGPVEILLVTSPTTLRCLMRSIMCFNWRYTITMALHNASVSIYHFTDSIWFPHCTNDTSHLRE